MILKSIANTRFFLAIAFTFSAFSAQAAALSDLYDKVPRPPSSLNTALSWVKDGEIVQAEYVAMTKAIADERARIIAANGGKMPESYTSVPTISDSPEIKAAARGYSDYLLRNQGKNDPKAELSQRKRWLQMAYGGKQMALTRRMAPCAKPCTDPAALEKNKPLLKKRNFELHTEIQSWNALFDDWKKNRVGYIITADPLIAGAKPTTAEGKAMMASYQAAMLGEVEYLLSITKLCLLRAEAIYNGLDGSESDAITGATKKAAK